MATDNHSGTNDNSYPKPDRVEGYNDLERRKKDLCTLVQSPCTHGDLGSVVVAIATKAGFNVLALHGH